MEAMFKSKLKGSEWLPWQSCIDSLQSVGCTLQEAKSFLKEYGSWIRVKDFLDILFASPKEKQKLEDFMKMKKPISLCLPLRITFKLRETPSVLSNMADKTFAGRIKPGAKYCYASYPGKFKTGFEALSSDVGEFGDQSVACVYFCKKEDGLGSHHPDPEDSKGRCYCRRIYGEGNDSNRDYQTFGYIHWIGAPYGEKMANAQKVAEAMNAVLVREDASEEEKTHAIREAKRRWNQSGRVAAWGCLWLHVWFGHMKEAVKRRQRLKVVYYPGMVGKGKVTMKDLQDPNVSLWDSDPKNRGLGGSQKAEVAIIEDMRELEGAAWDYDEVDVSEFLKDSFSPGNTVAALDGHEWKRGVIIGVDGLQWKVRCQRTNQVLTTDRVRHESEAVEKFATIFSEAFGASLPDGEVVATCPREERLEDGVLTMRFDLQCKDVAALKALCSAVLSGHLESAIQDRDDFGRLSAGVHIEKTEFVKAYKHVLMSSIDLTPHQEEKVKELEGDGDFHLSAAAGSGKTFVAVRKVLLTLDANSEGQVLFVAPTKALCLHFLQWFVAMHGGDEADVVKQFARLRLMYAPYNSCMTASLKGNKIELAKDEGPNIQFVLSIVDEAHDIFRTDVEQGVLREILLHSSKQRILLSDASQSGAVKQNYPKEIQFQEKHLSQVVRSTDRIVLGAKSFQLPPESSEQLPTDESSSSCAGPPLKTFLFEPEDAASPSPPFQEYCRYTISALRHVISSYPDLRLHHCVAIIVPNPDFLNRFKPVLEKVLRDPITHKSFLVQHKTPQLPAPLPRPPQLSAPLPRPLLPPPPLPAQLLPPRKPDPADQDELAGKNLRFIDFEESLSYIVTSDTVENCKEECIILDSVDNAKGLEELIVISVGMDAEIGSEGAAVPS
ncbi:unnamed protein product [Durusdinium trenchii]|uniref:Helicase ATP-binding domain-containing protein n=1 Tax=Durusdinium trenchii TaxID=1381693 RepID=A0ABP0MBE1_9DINO